jgi:RNA ligase
MYLYDYLGIGPHEFQTQYLDDGYVQEGKHAEFPLNIYSYSRSCVKEQKWDKVTSKCRGIIVNRLTSEIIARPFEKFHNYGSEIGSAPAWFTGTEPTVWEKMDGFMCTRYVWGGKQYIASKGSFHSVHAKWATAELNRVPRFGFPEGWTAVFEGLRIVIDYGKREELVMLALINNETGQEASPVDLKTWAKDNGFSTARQIPITLEDARLQTMGEREGGLDEGYVLTWYQDEKPPFRLKMKRRRAPTKG